VNSTDWKPRECCGVVGAYSQTNSDITRTVYDSLFELYNRGQESTGICVYLDKGSRLYRILDYRPIHEAFNRGKDLPKLHGYWGIGHNRYSTTGESDISHAQPFEMHDPFTFAIAHNGTIRNSNVIKATLESAGEQFETNSDTEVIMKLIAHEGDIIRGLQRLSLVAEGSYALTIATKDGIYGVRDPHGIKPLCIGRGKDTVVIASESCVFNNDNGIKFDRDLERGEVFYVGVDGEQSISLGKRGNALDIFELVYFARSDSVIDGIDVCEYRIERGRRLARREFIEPDSNTVIAAVPYSGIDYAIGYAEELYRRKGVLVPNREVFLRKRHTRSFIEPSYAERKLAILQKLAPKVSQIVGKKIMLIDDSTVRGTTDRELSKMLRKHGAIEIHKRNGFPPVVDTCPFGIDMKTKDEHIANQIPDSEERTRELGFDSMMYNLPEDLVPDGYSLDDFCTHCITSIDPLAADRSKVIQIGT